MTTSRKFLLLLVLAPLAGAHADAYKWVGEDGTVHYGQQPPHRQAAERVALPKAPAANPLPALRERSQAAQAQRREASDAAADAQVRGEQEQARIDACTKMRSNLDVLQTRNRIRELKNGEYVALSPREQQGRIEELQEQISQHCNDA